MDDPRRLAGDDAGPARRELRTLYWLAGYSHLAVANWAILSPYLAREFGLDDAQTAFLAGVISLGAFGTFALARLADRHGRRRILLAAFAGLPLAALATALAPGEGSFAAAQIAASGLNGALMSLVMVIIAEEIAEGARAEGQAWFGLAGALGSALPLVLISLLEDVPGGWRYAWGASALPLLAWAAVRRNVPETRRFERAEASGRIAGTRPGDLFRGRYRRRAIGMLVAGTLRPVAIVAALTWSIYHMVQNLELRGGEVLIVLGVGGGLSMLGIPLGARLANRWGRRPTAACFSALSIVAAVAFYWVPPDLPPHHIVWLAFTFFLSQLGLQAFGVADRCIDTELFPTALRATYAGWCRVAVAAATSFSHFAVSALTVWLGSLVPAITLLALVMISLSLVVFLAICPETRGLSLDAAALEEAPDPGEAELAAARRDFPLASSRRV